jgi:hypothetical protein
MEKFKLGQQVYVAHEEAPFTGEITRIEKWENPLKKIKGTDYVVRANDDRKQYRTPEEMIIKI